MKKPDIETIQVFTGTLPRGFQGNIAYSMTLPDHLTALSVILTYNKERIPDETSYARTYSKDLLPVLKEYLGHTPSEQELLHFVHSMKTEIQLCLTVSGAFVGNVHMPGTKKEITVSAEYASHGCIPCASLKGAAKIIINVFQVVENDTNYKLEVKGEFSHVETHRTA